MEKMRNGIFIIREILFEGNLEAFVDVLALNKQERQAVDEANDICSPAVEITLHP